MALSYVSYTAGAAQTDFTITFDYILEDYVKVYIDGVLKTVTTDYTFFNSTTIRLNTPATGGEIVRIERQTLNTSRLVDFVDGGNLTEADLDNSADQLFHLVQEQDDSVNDLSMQLDTDDKWDAESKIIKNVTDGVANNDAANVGQINSLTSAAVAAAQAAQTAAEAAQTAAETAEANAASSETNAATSYDNFDDRYLGQKSSAPTLDNDGNALLTGALYFNTSDSTMYVYNGTAWQAAAANLDIEFGRPNLFDNGDFRVNQRYGQIKYTSVGSGVYVADRWQHLQSVTACVVDAQIVDVTDGPDGSLLDKCLEYTVTTADASRSSGENMRVIQFISGNNIGHLNLGNASGDAVYCTLTFWHKHSKTGRYGLALQNSAGNWNHYQLYTQDVANTWEKYEHTFALTDTGTWLTDKGTIGIRAIFGLLGGTTYENNDPSGTWNNDPGYWPTSSQAGFGEDVGDKWRIGKVKLEVGTGYSGPDAGSQNYEQCLDRCKRYYQQSANDQTLLVHEGNNDNQIPAVAISTSSMRTHVDFEKRMAGTPTITIYRPTSPGTGSGDNWAYFDVTWQYSSSLAVSGTDEYGFNATLTTGTVTVGDGHIILGSWAAEVDY